MPYLPIAEAMSHRLLSLYQARVYGGGPDEGVWEVVFPDTLNAAFWADNVGASQLVTFSEEMEGEPLSLEVMVAVDEEQWAKAMEAGR
jgi:hypothetical protein